MERAFERKDRQVMDLQDKLRLRINDMIEMDDEIKQLQGRINK